MVDNYSKNNNSQQDEFEVEFKPLSPFEKIKNTIKELVQSISNPKRLITVVAAITCFILFLIFFFIFGSNKTQQNQAQKPIFEDGQAQVEVVPVVAPSIPVETELKSQSIKEAEPIAPPSLPTLNIDVLDKLNAFNNKDSNYKDAIDNVDVNALKLEQEEEEEEEEILDLKIQDDYKEQTKVVKNRKIDPENPPPSIIIGQGSGPSERSRDKIVSDFIFVDSAMSAEDSTDVPNEGKRIPNLGNIVAQGRIIDAVLETAINSSIPGTIRAVISRDVYAEAGRNILIPKGTRLYGSYSASNLKSGRLVITWSRILRPDGISVGISSFASDQFGRSGVQGNIDKKYGETITAALLISSIPLIGTIVAQQATGGRVSDTSQTSASGVVTVTTDPINQATTRFTKDLSDATSKIVQDLIDTSVVITIDQGTRIKVMVNQDLQLVAYKPLTALNTTITYSSQ